MQKFLVFFIFLIISCSGGGDSHYHENKIISHELRNGYGEIVDSIGGCESLSLRFNFQVGDANLKQLCGYYYPDYYYGKEHELVCFDLHPSSVGKSLEWKDGIYYPDCNMQFTEDWDVWVDVWLVYGDENVSPVYTVFIEVK